MGGQQSKEELLYQQVNYGNVEGIKSLRREGAGLEWVDKEGRTPLILACMKPDYLHVAKILVELGANVNAYRPGSHGGTPLHHAAKRGLEQTVILLLSHGANASVMNDDCQTALDLARSKGYINVIRAIESRICIFSGWLRELYGPGILEALAPQWVTRKIWAVILPCDHRNHMNPLKFELAIYPDLQQPIDGEREIRCRRRRRRKRRLERKVARPRTCIALWKVEIVEPNFKQTDPAVVIVDKGAKARFKFLSVYEGDKQQLMYFYNACKGQRQLNVSIPAAPAPAAPAHAPMASHPIALTSATLASATSSAPEDIELAMAINASIQSAMAEGVPPFSNVQPIHHVGNNTNGWGSSSDNASHSGWGPSDGPSSSPKLSNEGSNKPATTDASYSGWVVPEPCPSANSGQVQQSQQGITVVIPSVQDVPPPLPSAPPINETFDDGPIHYPSIDSSPINLTSPVIESRPGTSEVKEGKESGRGTGHAKEESGDTSSSCIICLDAPVEGACIPCGHMAGCMSCLNEIKGKKWGCPVCRAKIDQIVRLYAV